MASQKAAFRNKKLAPEKLNLLATLGVSLSDGRATQWERQLIACKAFLEINHRLPSTKDTSANGMKIGEWLCHQRDFFRKNKLSKEKIERFEELLGPVWDPMADRWNRKFDAYKDYVEKTGKQPTRRTLHNGVNIGVWRIYLRNNSAPLSQDQINSLNALGMNIALNSKQGGKNHDGLSQGQVTNEEWRNSIPELRRKNLEKFQRLIPKLGGKNQDQNNNLDAVGVNPPLISEFLGRLERERNRQFATKRNKLDPENPLNGLMSKDWDETAFDDQLRRNFADQTDDDWFQFYLWCREIANSGTKILVEVPTHKIQGIKTWLRVQRTLYLDNKLSKDRRRLLKNLRHLWR